MCCGLLQITAWKEKIKARYQVGSCPEHPTAACMIQGQHHYDMLDEARLDVLVKALVCSSSSPRTRPR
jgi:hypothetical protein